MNIVYSIDAKLGGSGIGFIAYNAAAGIHHAGLLARLFVSSNAQTTIPRAHIRQWGIVGRGVKYLAAKDSTGLIAYLENTLFDYWVAAQLPAADIFHGWNNMCLQSLRRARARGTATVVERASAHPATHARLMREEYARWNVPLKFPMWNYARARAEFAEADFITVPSSFARASMIAEGVPENELVEIPFGVDLARFSPTVQTTAHPFRAIFAGTISINKGIPDLLEAWRRLRWRDAELWLVGAVAPDFAAIRARWSDLPGVLFIPHSKELAQLFRQCDVFIFPSIQEGSALVNYEAMAAGLPVITTPNAGSVARDGAEGFIVPIRDMDALCDRLERLRRDDALRTRLGRAARVRVEQFTWTHYQARLLAFYQRVQAERAR
ncbi:MAG: glycosyltransferase family 4 protein [Anaerolineales bacterium]|nr:glycosyltransferase family 4 protein [Anaerolineales bacterium]